MVTRIDASVDICFSYPNERTDLIVYLTGKKMNNGRTWSSGTTLIRCFIRAVHKRLLQPQINEQIADVASSRDAFVKVGQLT